MKDHSLLVAGCGYLGLRVCREATSMGWKVWGLRRNPEAAGLIREMGGEAIIADLTDLRTLTGLPPVSYAVSCQGAGRGADYRLTYLEGTKNLVAALEKQPPRQFLWISSTRVYGQTNGEWVDEATDPKPFSDEGRILLESEKAALSAPFPSLVLRSAGIYGPGRDRTKLLKGDSVDLGGWANQIHVDDLAGLILLLLEKGRSGEVYLGVDDRPVLKSEFYPWLARQTGVPLPPAGPAGSGTKRISNGKVKALGYVFKYPDYLSGFPEVLRNR